MANNDKKTKLTRALLFTIPIAILIITMFLSSYLFQRSKDQTYQRIKSAREDQVRILVRQMDGLVQDSGQPMTDFQKKMLKNSVERINDNTGVYCYLFNKDFKLISDFSASAEESVGQKIVWQFINRQEEIRNQDIDNNFGHLMFSIEGTDDYEIYWQEVPTGDSEYYIALGIRYQELPDSESTNLSKVLLGCLNLALSFSAYGNIMLYDRLKDKDNEKKKK